VNSKKTIQKALLLSQGFYTFATAVWALIDIESFMVVTGPKTDIWLVKTVSVVLVPIGVSLILPAFFPSTFWQPFVIGALSAVGLAMIDFYYSSNDIISDIYFWDGILQCLFLLCWIFLLIRHYR
jgi:hypothetical protein